MLSNELLAKLKAKGYTDEELKSPVFQDPRFTSTLDESFSALEQERDTFKGQAETWDTWYTEKGLPTVESALKRAQDEAAARAAAEARLKVAQEQGLIKVAQDAGEPSVPVASSEAFDPKKYKLVTQEDIAVYANQEGDAIMLAADVAAEYQELFGKSLYSYMSPDGKSRGMQALRREAVAHKQRLDEYVAQKFNYQAKRQELSSAEASRREAEIRADERAKAIAEVANPMMRTPSPSTRPFSLPKTGEGKMPWDQGDRSGERVQKALSHVLQ